MNIPFALANLIQTDRSRYLCGVVLANFPLNCLISSSVDGSIASPFWHQEAGRASKEIFSQISDGIKSNVSIMGADSAAQYWTEGFLTEKLPAVAETYPRKDYIAVADADYYFAIVDVEGTLAYKQNIIIKNDKIIDKSRGKSYHPIEVLTESLLLSSFQFAQVIGPVDKGGEYVRSMVE